MASQSQHSSPFTDALQALGKCLFALTIFGTVFGGWHWVMARQPLPGASERSGACVLWFVGSSSMSRWATLQRDLQPWIAQNRGIANASMAEINVHFAHDKAVRAPQAIVYYAGDNDLAFGRSVADTIGDLRAFIDLKTQMFGATPVFVISLKPSPIRWELRDEQSAYNAAAKAIAERRIDISYVDTVSLLMINGGLGPYYIDDGLHLNDAGYQRWRMALRKSLSSDLPPNVLKRCHADETLPAA